MKLLYQYDYRYVIEYIAKIVSTEDEDPQAILQGFKSVHAKSDTEAKKKVRNWLIENSNHDFYDDQYTIVDCN